MTTTGRPHLFSVRVWHEETELRGSVRDAATGAYRSFRAWPDLVEFIAGQLRVEEEPDDAGNR